MPRLPTHPASSSTGLVPSRLRLAVAAAVLAASLTLSARRLGPVPALGAFLDPAGGVWAIARSAAITPMRTGQIPALERPVTVLVDRRAVPHIFAATEADAYRALGYLVARDRLFQLDLQARAAAGRLSEWLGPRALELDRDARRLGFGRLVEHSVGAGDTSAPGFRSIRAYAEGVNAWIDGLGRAGLPLEYRLLGVRPRRWRVEDSYFLLGRMSLVLAFNDVSLIKTTVARLVGVAAADALFPLDSPIQEPIQPTGAGRPRYAFAPLPPPGLPDTSAVSAVELLLRLRLGLGLPGRREPEVTLGSNNWAVAPARAAAGRALLAGDPHLELTLPSVWYEAHLVVPGRLDVAGVTLVGAPWVVIGFNRSLAWSLTNTGADVTDLYREIVDDSLTPRRYRLDGTWRDLEDRVETYRGPDGAAFAADTVHYTHRGPMNRIGGAWLSLAWTLYQNQGSGEEWLGIDRARSVEEFLEASRTYAVPAQNMLVADGGGGIAIRSTGRYPVRPGDGRGDWIRDGSLSATDWVGSLPTADYPFARDPLQGFLASANQQPVDPLVSRRYLGAAWPSPWRALRINALLRADSAVTVDAMRRFQTDPASPRADAFVPYFLAAARNLEGAGRATDQLHRAARLLGEWDRRYLRENRRAILFELAMRELVRRTWDELIPPEAKGDSAGPIAVPEGAVLLDLLHDSASVWWDDRRTPAVRETRDDILAAALTAGLARALRELGPPDGEGWVWANAHHANIYHLLRLPALSALGLPVQGGPSTLNPSGEQGTSGPSWRMVVELGDQVRAWATYPGGQSGNPASPHYVDRLPQWLAGELDPVEFPATAESLDPSRIESRLHLTPVR